MAIGSPPPSGYWIVNLLFGVIMALAAIGLGTIIHQVWP